jgi:formate dehydrogenase major subunit
MLERFLGDSSLDDDLDLQPSPRTGKHVTIIGGGPAGIAAAYSLTLSGHEVEVIDNKPKPGGYLRTGIPAYRLPKNVLDREIARVEKLGVTFAANTHVGRDVRIEDLFERSDAIVVAVGLHTSRPLAIAGSDHPQVYNGVDLLEKILAGKAPHPPTTSLPCNAARCASESQMHRGVRRQLKSKVPTRQLMHENLVRETE